MVCDNNWRSNPRLSVSDNRSCEICLASGYGDAAATIKRGDPLATIKRIGNAITDSNDDTMIEINVHRCPWFAPVILLGGVLIMVFCV